MWQETPLECPEAGKQRGHRPRTPLAQVSGSTSRQSWRQAADQQARDGEVTRGSGFC